MKTKYNKPAAEELQELLAAAILEASAEGDIEGYIEGSEFNW